MNKKEFEALTLKEKCNFFEREALFKANYVIGNYLAQKNYSITNSKGVFKVVKKDEARNRFELEVKYHQNHYHENEVCDDVQANCFIPIPDFVFDGIDDLFDSCPDENDIEDMFEEIFFAKDNDFNLYFFLDSFTDEYPDFIDWDYLNQSLTDACKKLGLFTETPTVKETLSAFAPTSTPTVATTTKIDESESEGEKIMFKGMKLFKGLENVDTSKVKMTMLGMGVENSQGVVQTYNAITGELTDVTDFVMDGFGSMSDMVFVFPAQKVGKGDLVAFNGSICHVTGVQGTRINAIDYNTNQEVNFVKQKHALGFNFVPKIMSPFGNMFTATAKDPVGGFESMLPMMMMMSMGKGDSDKGGMGGMVEMMMMSQMFGGGMTGGQNPFATMFGGMLGESEEVAEEVTPTTEKK